MPRLTDVYCPDCDFSEEIQKEMDVFQEFTSTLPPCPRCGKTYRFEKPAVFNIVSGRPVPATRKPRFSFRLASDKPLSQDVRILLAKELFDPCSCGDHAPADLFEHQPDCHVNRHSFMQDNSDESLENNSKKAV